jgi:Uma2 family endonuclease
MSAQTEHNFNVQEYYRLAETGVLRPDARVELLNGRIMGMSPIGPLHGSLVKRLSRLFTLQAKDRWIVSTQDPVRLADHSEPEPDVALLKPSSDVYASHHPQPEDVYLLIEVADTTLDYDRGEKIPAYGRAGIVEVWVVNLVNATLEVYRDPHFTGYGSKTILGAGDQTAPQAFPDAVVDVAELLTR